jgi:uncharacterized protein YqgV (UPF0045/DUF77 family)
MDKKIKQIQKQTNKLAKEEKELLKADHARDKTCKLGEKVKKMKDKK